MADRRPLFERDYALLRNLAMATALAVFLPRGFASKSISAVLILITVIIGWSAVFGEPTPPPLSMVKVRQGEVVEGLSYNVASPDGNGMQQVEFRNDLDVRVKNVMFQCQSSLNGPYELMLQMTYEPHTSATETALGQTSDQQATCWMKSYETYAP